MRYVMRIFDTPLLEFEASYGEGQSTLLVLPDSPERLERLLCRISIRDSPPMRNFETDTPKYVKTKHPYIWTYQ